MFYKIFLVITLLIVTASCKQLADNSQSNESSNQNGVLQITIPKLAINMTASLSLVDQNGTDSSQLTIQWYRDEEAVSGANSLVYTISKLDLGHSISVRVRYTDDANFTENLTSNQLFIPVEADNNTHVTNSVGQLAISGAQQVGSALTVTITDANGLTNSQIQYQWYRNGNKIAASINQTYVLVEADWKQTITVNASYTDDAGFTEKLQSNTIIPIAVTPINIEGMLAINGGFAVGELLTLTISDVNGVNLNDANIQWSSGGVALANANTSTLQLSSSDVGNSIAVTVSYIDADGFAETLYTTSDVTVKTKLYQFELIDWYLSIPTDDDNNGRSDSISETELAAGYTNSQFFWYNNDGSLVFRCPTTGYKTSENTKYVRVELREMLRRGNKEFSTQGVGKNNWVFSSAPQSAQDAAGGVDGSMTVTMAVNEVTTSGESYQVGRLVIGQIHANDDEPIRLYYRKLPNNTKGSIYFAHEPIGESDEWYEMIGSRDNNASNPTDGIALNEKFTYNITVIGDNLTVTIIREGKDNVVKSISMANSGYDDPGQYQYFKVGLYHLNNSATNQFAQITVYHIANSHLNYDFSE